MNTILLQPTDVLFFRDGRPMSGSLSGHGAAWPLPSVINHAFHAALHRAGLNGVHAHRRGRSGHYEETRDRLFGSLLTAGPFPVSPDGHWFFPTPADFGATGKATLLPYATHSPSSLPAPLKYPVANSQPPSKETGTGPWLSASAWQSYLDQTNPPDSSDPPHHLKDDALFDTESTIGIAIDPATGTTGHGETEGQIYSAHYLRLRDGWRLGVFATAWDKDLNQDLIQTLLNGHGHHIIVGGQQRLCTAVLLSQSTQLPLPRGKGAGFHQHNGKSLVKWTLLTPAIFPEIKANPEKNITAHPGGWLPNWIAEKEQQFEGETVPAGSVLLLNGPGKEKAKRKKLQPGKPIPARLVAAIVPKPIPITGWALPNEADRPEGGAKSTHLAVPAGAVYYFEADTPEAADQLAAALNWHGPPADPSHPSDPSNFATIKNRRSTLLGEKGFGLGVCGTWLFHSHPTDPSDPSNPTSTPHHP